MARTVYFTATSADGYVADAEGSLAWLSEVPRGDGQDATWSDFISRVGALVMGSTTFHWVVEHVQLREHPERWAEMYGDRPAWVLSHHELTVVPGVVVRHAEGDVAALHTELVDAAGNRDVWVVGGGDLAGQFADAGLLDEIHLGVCPVFLGSGAPVLPRRLTAERLRLRSVTQRGQRAQTVFDVLS